MWRSNDISSCFYCRYKKNLLYFYFRSIQYNDLEHNFTSYASLWDNSHRVNYDQPIRFYNVFYCSYVTLYNMTLTFDPGTQSVMRSNSVSETEKLSPEL